MADLTVDAIIAIHSRLIAQENGDARLLSEANLHQLVFQVNISGDIFYKAAFVLFSFCAYPPFREGNVQTAFCIINKILDDEDYQVEQDTTEIAALVLGVESFTLEIEDLEDWMHRNVHKRSNP
jgi:prophage maintenance system killer protein